MCTYVCMWVPMYNMNVRRCVWPALFLLYGTRGSATALISIRCSFETGIAIFTECSVFVKGRSELRDDCRLRTGSSRPDIATYRSL